MILLIVPLSIVGLYVTLQSDKSLENSIGTHFKTIADAVGGEASQLIHDRVIAVAVMAGEPTILDAIAASNRSYQNVPEPAISARFEKMESSWNSPASDAFVKELLAARSSALLRRHHDIDPRFLKITVTDARGATVAATHKPVRYVQADTEHWRAVYAEGKGAVNLTEIAYDEQTKSNYIGVGVPVMDEGSGRFLGTIHALVDVSDLFLLFSQLPIGPTGRALLVKEDGTVISGPDGQPFDELEVGGIRGRKRGDGLSDWPADRVCRGCYESGKARSRRFRRYRAQTGLSQSGLGRSRCSG